MEAESAVTDRFRLDGKVALVTGGSRGLGREMVLAFAAAGADVVIASRKLAACETLAAEVEETTGRKALAHACHVGHWDELSGLAAAAYDRFGKVDVLVNNAGMSPRYGSLHEVTEELYDKVLDVNLKGVFRLSALIAPRMVEAGGGSIVNVGSVGAHGAYPGEVPYAAAKAGVEVMTRGFARAYGPLVRVNCIVAGPFLTDISAAWEGATTTDAIKSSSSLQRAGQPHEIVGTALYFASEASSFTTGATIKVDGGL